MGVGVCVCVCVCVGVGAGVKAGAVLCTVDDAHPAVERALLGLQLEQRIETRRVPPPLESFGAVRTHSGDQAEAL